MYCARNRKSRIEFAQGREVDARQGQIAFPIARGGRNRLRHHRAPADVLSRRPPRRGAALSRLSGDGRKILGEKAKSIINQNGLYSSFNLFYENTKSKTKNSDFPEQVEKIANGFHDFISKYISHLMSWPINFEL